MAPMAGACSAVNEGEKNTWVYLEEVANTLLSNVQQLKALIEQAKNAAVESGGVKAQGSRKEVLFHSTTVSTYYIEKLKQFSDLQCLAKF